MAGLKHCFDTLRKQLAGPKKKRVTCPSAVNCFIRMLQRCADAGCQLVFAASPRTLEEQMRRAAPQETEAARFLPDLDRALDWCEDAVLERELAHLAALGGAQGRDRLFDLVVDDLLLHLGNFYPTSSFKQGVIFQSFAEALGNCNEHLFFRGKDIVLIDSLKEAGGPHDIEDLLF